MIVITKAHKIKLNPTQEQEKYFWRAAGIARFAFNWGVAEYNRRLDYNRQVEKTGEGEKLKCSGRLLKKEFNTFKPEWVSEVTCWAYQGAFDDLQKAYTNYFDKHKKGLLLPPKGTKPRNDNRPFGWPTFKSRHRSTPSFYLANISIRLDNHFVTFDTKRVGPVNMAEKLRFDGRILAGRVSYRSGRWWLSIQVEIEHETPQMNNDAVGVDLGIKYLAVTSDGITYDNPKPLKQAERNLKRLQRKLDRQRRANNPDNYNEAGTPKRGVEWVKSNNMIKTDQAISKLSYRVACIRNETSHRMTTEIAKDYGIIGVEDLNIKGMMKNGRMSKAMADAALFEKRRQLTYKAEWNGGIVTPISQWFPSSKKCNVCDWINQDLQLKDRKWTCGGCGTVHHRDGNAAVNIRNEAIRILTNE